MRQPGRILYDAECRFCRWALAWVLRWDRRGGLVPVALHEGEAGALLTGMPEAERAASWHLVDANGRVTSAGAAIAPLLRLLPGGPPLAAALERLPAATERGYRFVADHRAAFARPLTDPAIARADRVISARRPAPETTDLS